MVLPSPPALRHPGIIFLTRRREREREERRNGAAAAGAPPLAMGAPGLAPLVVNAHAAGQQRRRERERREREQLLRAAPAPPVQNNYAAGQQRRRERERLQRANGEPVVAPANQRNRRGQNEPGLKSFFHFCGGIKFVYSRTCSSSTCTSSIHRAREST